MRLCLSLLVALASSASAQPGQMYDPNAPPPPAEPAPYVPPHPATPMPHPSATHATFVSTGETRWDIRVDGNAACTTPCSLVVDPMRYVTLHSQDSHPTRLAVGHMPAGQVLVRAQPRAQGAFAAGVTFTTLSGLGLATGITLTAVGCSTERDTMCNAGLITGVASAVGLYLSIGLLRSSLPRVHVDPARQTVGYARAF